jgi:dihydroneopterin aldolase
MMSGTLYIKNINVDCIIGILEHERHTLQPITIDIAIDLDVTDCIVEEDIAKTIDYAHLTHEVREHCIAKKYRLIETTAVNLCDLVLAYPQAQKVTLTVTKPLALGGSGIPAIQVTKARPTRV